MMWLVSLLNLSQGQEKINDVIIPAGSPYPSVLHPKDTEEGLYWEIIT